MTTVDGAGSWVRFTNSNEARLDWPVLCSGVGPWRCLPAQAAEL